MLRRRLLHITRAGVRTCDYLADLSEAVVGTQTGENKLVGLPRFERGAS